jgi:hypothetical protein
MPRNPYETSNRAFVKCGCCLLIVGILLIVILVPLSFSYVDYYEYGLVKRRSSGFVDTSAVYASGRYRLGPTHKFFIYQADAFVEHLESLSVFSAGGNESIGLEFLIDVDFTFFLVRDELGLLYDQLASSYESVIVSRAIEGIKNEAVYVTFNDYFQSRLEVEKRFRVAVQARWNQDPPLHCTLDQFNLGYIQIPDSVAQIQLDNRIQTETNAMLAYDQQAQLVQETTAVEVNNINLEADNILQTVQAQAGYIQAKAIAQSKQLIAEAQLNGTTVLFQAAGIQSQEEKIAFDYIRALANRDNLTMEVSYVAADSVLRTTAIA